MRELGEPTSNECAQEGSCFVLTGQRRIRFLWYFRRLLHQSQFGGTPMRSRAAANEALVVNTHANFNSQRALLANRIPY